MTGSLTFVLGGARSGKSRHGEALIAEHPAPWHYIATAEALDAEMGARIAAHRARRDARWITAEAPRDVAGALGAIPDGAPVLVDCLTLWLSNLLLAEADLEAETGRLVEILAAPRGPWVAIANEVGLGIVPENALARRFRDAAGVLNQRLAARADRVILTVAGIPIRAR
ncbi:bifunctional adenosylcobinamide kinase/adenosylcobinamide-phosphate guanylyltransferase [Amaricoccus solimangrovi]|uniref:Bifunctional adenosylcobalamin biosynthesis protein n=1 Tax=Amaricoccus solimangrovi TaxID=2589815 RepID=A0A501WQ27_9RHOB|nr:bifunctional adenosylcobinamide kinase/adenosylcobinamide-phosphate guanylyltransferase [Amaricoccus solimangrovi]TPE50450.1 bifunctional adenosylcobinamide kinase/adenosylcobinamide-phosphate guanylyltransferase [Amaricoccus solimangrovi]